MAKNPNSIWYLAGTERTGAYNVLARTALGTIGVRELSDGSVRIRVEPTEAGAAVLASAFPRSGGWKQPGDSSENRFSTVVDGSDRAGYEDIVKRALHALVAGGNVPRVNPKGRVFARRMLTKEALVSEVRSRANVAGKNLASTWGIEALCRKLTA